MQDNLEQAIQNPEYLLDHWINLPIAPNAQKKVRHLTLREAILLALRYNPNIQSAELDRIIQRYQLRLANNEFELQYALAGAANYEKNQYSGIGEASNSSYLITPEVNLKTSTGGQIGLNLENNVPSYNRYTPVLNFSFMQPLLRGFGSTVNEATLKTVMDNENINKLRLKQSVVDQITEVIMAYRILILSGNNLENQKRQLQEAYHSYRTNKEKIQAGQLEPTANIQQSYQIESLRLMVEQAENDFRTAAQELLQAIGLDPQLRLAVPSDVEVEKLIVPNLKESIQQALTHNVSYLSQQAVLRADERAYTVAKNQQLWQLDFSANAQSARVTDVDTNTRGVRAIYSGENINKTANLTLTVPIHDISRRSQLINAKVTLEKDRLNEIAMRRALETRITNIINGIKSQIKRYQLAKKQVTLALKSYELEKKKQQAGIASALEVNNTQNQLLQAQAGLITAKIAYLNQLSALEQLLGTTLNHWHIQLRYGK